MYKYVYTTWLDSGVLYDQYCIIGKCGHCSSATHLPLCASLDLLQDYPWFNWGGGGHDGVCTLGATAAVHAHYICVV